jgi:hypothetical protein
MIRTLAGGLPIHPPFEKGADMTKNLHADLEALRREITQKGRAPVVLPQAALEQHFHGLTLGQVVRLTDAPVLATVAEIQVPDGVRMERFCVDGADPELCHVAARHFLLDSTSPPSPYGVREVRTCNSDLVRETMVRDGGVIYRLMDQEAIVDEPLTRTLQTLQQRDAYSASGGGSPSAPAMRAGCPSTIDEVPARIFQGLTDVRTCNAAARCIVARLIRSTGEQDLETALAAADSETLRTAFQQVLAMSDEIEALLDALMTQANDLLKAARCDRVPVASQGAIMASGPVSEQMPMDGFRMPF